MTETENGKKTRPAPSPEQLERRAIQRIENAMATLPSAKSCGRVLSFVTSRVRERLEERQREQLEADQARLRALENAQRQQTIPATSRAVDEEIPF